LIQTKEYGEPGFLTGEAVKEKIGRLDKEAPSLVLSRGDCESEIVQQKRTKKIEEFQKYIHDYKGMLRKDTIKEDLLYFCVGHGWNGIDQTLPGFVFDELVAGKNVRVVMVEVVSNNIEGQKMFDAFKARFQERYPKVSENFIEDCFVNHFNVQQFLCGLPDGTTSTDDDPLCAEIAKNFGDNDMSVNYKVNHANRYFWPGKDVAEARSALPIFFNRILKADKKVVLGWHCTGLVDNDFVELFNKEGGLANRFLGNVSLFTAYTGHFHDSGGGCIMVQKAFDGIEKKRGDDEKSVKVWPDMKGAVPEGMTVYENTLAVGLNPPCKPHV